MTEIYIGGKRIRKSEKSARVWDYLRDSNDIKGTWQETNFGNMVKSFGKIIEFSEILCHKFVKNHLKSIDTLIRP